MQKTDHHQEEHIEKGGNRRRPQTQHFEERGLSIRRGMLFIKFRE